MLGIVRSLFRPDILHCHDWQAALVPVLMRREVPPRSDVLRNQKSADDPQPRLSGDLPAQASLRALGLPEDLLTRNRWNSMDRSIS